MIDCSEIQLLTELYKTWLKTIGIPENKVYNPPQPQTMVNEIIDSLKKRMGYLKKIEEEGVL